eukprot:INCI5934.5.p1 GENE.INCI5934.5~~INCI5934.5.p1  ORF type:complete len:442 (-),score=71.29 INCI5934.5:1403-2575(-)
MRVFKLFAFVIGTAVALSAVVAATAAAASFPRELVSARVQAELRHSGDDNGAVINAMKEMLLGSLEEALPARSARLRVAAAAAAAPAAHANASWLRHARDSASRGVDGGLGQLRAATTESDVIQRAYREHCVLRTDTRRFTVPPSNFARSDARHLLYFEVPKAASTAVRQILHRELGGDPQLIRGSYRLNETELAYYKFTFVRDPIDRFVSNFNFLTVFNPSLGKDRKDTETAKLAARRWVQDLYDKGWWNWHLWPQALYLASPDGSPRALDFVLPVDKLQQGFDIVASQGDEAVGTSLRNSKQGHVRTDVIPPFGGRYSKQHRKLVKQRFFRPKTCANTSQSKSCGSVQYHRPRRTAAVELQQVHWVGFSILFHSQAVDRTCTQVLARS